MTHISQIKKIAAGAGIVAAMTSIMVAPSLAVDTVTQSVTSGSLTSSVDDLTLTSVAYSHVVQNQTGSMTLTTDDQTGTGAGWNVTIQTSDFVYSGSNSGTDIPAANFALSSADAPTMTAGQAIDVTGGPKVPASSPVGTLDSARKVIQANANYGQGTYTQSLDVNLTIPEQSRAGTYTGTLTTTVSTAP